MPTAAMADQLPMNPLRCMAASGRVADVLQCSFSTLPMALLGREHLLGDVAASQSLDGKHHFPEAALGSISSTDVPPFSVAI
jgi:hypothetical protein